MTKRWTKFAARVGRAVGYKTKRARAEELATRRDVVRDQSYSDEENARGGRRYFR
jgi:hypothetical protein